MMEPIEIYDGAPFQVERATDFKGPVAGLSDGVFSNRKSQFG
jgi:hypothetical protein